MPQQNSQVLVRLLHLEDSILDHELAQRVLRQAGMSFSITRVETIEAFLELLDSKAVDIVLADYRLPGFTALDVWDAISHRPDLPPFILLSGAIGETAAVEAIRLGISDYLLKDDMARLPHVIRRAIEVTQAKQARERAVAELAASEQRLARFAEHLQMAIEQERAAIAREIHDDIGGALTAVKFDLSWLGRHDADPAAQQHIDAALTMVQQAIGASQRIMLNLRPAILDQGLEAAVHWLATEFERRTGLKTRLHVNLRNTNINKETLLTAYRTAQEALTNISKHASCHEVRIDLSDAEDVLTLEIADDGLGIQHSARDKPRAFGLKGLAERARTVGGWLDISSRDGQGTAITLSVPLSAQFSSTLEEDSP